MSIFQRRFALPAAGVCVTAALLGAWAMAGDAPSPSLPEIHAAPVEVRALPPLPPPDSLAKLLVSPTSTVERGETAMLLDIIDASDRIGSSSQRAAVLMEITEMRALDSSVVSAVARASTRISSSSGRGHALRMLIRRHADATGASHRAVLDAVATMMSDSERAETLEMFVRRPRLSESALTAALTQAGRMRDGDDRSRVLIAAARANRIDGGARAAYVRAAAGINSERQRSRVLAAIERGGR